MASLASLDNDVAATSTPKRPVLVATKSIQDDANLMFQERDTSMTDDWATASERDFAAQRTVIGTTSYLDSLSRNKLLNKIALIRCVKSPQH